MPQTTILIPAFNFGKYIKEATESVVAQGYEDYKLLIIDDVNSPNTSQFIIALLDYMKNPIR